MYERWTRLENANDGECGYRHPRRPIAALVVLLLGVSCLCGAVWKLESAWPDEWQSVATSLLFGAIFLVTALQWATVRETWFARTPPRVTYVRNLLGWRHARVHDLEEGGVVTCEKRSEPDESDGTPSYQVLLRVPRSDAPIFIHSYFEHDEPAAIAREVADCLHWPFEDRTLANSGEVPSLSSYVLSAEGLSRVIRAAEKLCKAGAITAGLGVVIQSIIYIAGLCDVGMILGWAVACLVFLAMKAFFSFAHRRQLRTSESNRC